MNHLFKKYGIFSAFFLAIVISGVIALNHISPPIPDLRFSLTNDQNRHVTEKDFTGTAKLVFFGFTQCSNICPLTLSRLTDVYQSLKQRGQKIKILFITVDPEYDTPTVLAQYLASSDADITGLTGSKDELKSVYKAFRVYPGYARNTEKNKTIDHSGLVYLVGDTGHVLAHFTMQMSSSEIVRLITTALDAEQNKEDTV